MHSVQQPQPCAHLEGGTYPSVSGVDKTLAESAARGSRRFNGGAPDVQNNWGIIIGGGPIILSRVGPRPVICATAQDQVNANNLPFS